MSVLEKEEFEGSKFIGELFVDDWFKLGESKQIYVRYYLLPEEPKEGFFFPGIDGSSIDYAETSFKILIAEIAEQKYKTHISWMTKTKGTDFQLSIEAIDRELPRANYILITTPIRDSYESASESVDALVGALRATYGNRLLRQKVREAEVSCDTGAMKTPTSAILIPILLEGREPTLDVVGEFTELLATANSASKEISKRAIFALELLETSFLAEPHFKFFSYWTALEVAAGKHQKQNLLNVLTGTCGKSNAYVQNKLGFQHIWNTRIEVIHSGEQYLLIPLVERYMQCMVLDIVRGILGLNCKYFVEELILAGFDVSLLDRKIGKMNVLTVETPHK